MSRVFLISSRVLRSKGLLQKFTDLLSYLKLDQIKKNDNVLIKTHFGEDGNTTFINPMYIRKVVDFLKKKSSHPYVGDTNTLYSGRRKTGVTHLELALEHGFSFTSLNAPIVILDGMKSNNVANIAIDGKHFKNVQLGGDFFSADSMIVMSHVKGHLAAGMGGAIKNLSMGLGSRTQKQRMHGDIKPQYIQNKCVFCNRCVEVCPVEALTNDGDKIIVDLNKCVGCAECITRCPTQALKILWNETPDNLAEKMAETALAAVTHLRNRIFFFNFLIDIIPDCDCMDWSDNPVVNDIGILASDDPIAIDMASFDLINKQQKLNNSILEHKQGEVFSLMHPGIDPVKQLTYGEKIGIGSREYELVTLDW